MPIGGIEPLALAALALQHLGASADNSTQKALKMELLVLLFVRTTSRY